MSKSAPRPTTESTNFAQDDSVKLLNQIKEQMAQGDIVRVQFTDSDQTYHCDLRIDEGVLQLIHSDYVKANPEQFPKSPRDGQILYALETRECEIEINPRNDLFNALE